MAKSVWIIILTVISACILCLCYSEFTDSNDRYIVKIKQDSRRSWARHLENFNLTQLYQITPSTYIFEYNGSLETHGVLQKLSLDNGLYRHKIIKIEPVREYNDDLKPESSLSQEFRLLTSNGLSPTNLVCENYYGMGVSEAWSRGYTGNDVTIAITDVGVNTELTDMDNVNTNLSYNFMDENMDVTPEFYYNIQAKAAKFTDHGNKVASIVAAVKGNNICSAGIAYNATVIALKIYRVELKNGYLLELDPKHWTSSDIVSRALVYKLNLIDIFANAWAPTKDFDALDPATTDAIKFSAENGRQGLGTIHVFPSGPPGNGLSNNIYTITVNSVGIFGTVPDYVHKDASVLTSGLGTGNNLTAASMVTTSLKNSCVTSFKGVSAAAAQLPAIIALALEANKNLSLRDIQHLLVHASERRGLQQERSFRSNTAGRYFHDYFGFGFINAEKLVTLAEKKLPTSRLLSRSLTNYIVRRHIERTLVYEFCNACDEENKRHCLTTVEHVEINMHIKTTFAHLQIELKSPGKTVSVLVDYAVKKETLQKGKVLHFVSVHFWDEIPFGSWLLLVKHKAHSNRGSSSIRDLSLTFHGTNNEEVANHRHLYDHICDDHTRHNKNTTTEMPATKPAQSETNTRGSESRSKSTDNFSLIVIGVVASLAFVCLGLYVFRKRYGIPLIRSCPERKFNIKYSRQSDNEEL